MKRIISLMLSLVIILSLVCGAVPAVSAASAMKISDQGINMIKAFEGFQKYPQKDNTLWTIGYGTSIPESEVDRYNASGITDAQAVALMKEHLTSFERSVNSFIDTNKLTLNQQQFDALVSFTYNLGASWMQNEGTFRSAVINGTKGNEFIYAMAQYGKSGGTPMGGLIQRRLCEANLYLNGAYSTTPPANYKYVIYQSGMEGVVPTVSIQGYDSTLGAAIKSSVVGISGYRFMGWYTREEGGDWITALGSKSAGSNKLYAHWQNGEGPRNDDGSIKGTATNYSGYSANGAAKDVYKTPGGEKVSTVKGDAQVTVSAEYVDSSNKKWGKISTGWIDVTGGLVSAPVYEEAGSAISPITVTVTTGGVNNRIGPGTNYAKNGTYTKGQQLVLTAVQKGGNYTWGKSEMGWIALQYTNYDTVRFEDNADAKKVTAIGTIIRSNYVNVRAGAGTHHAKVGTYQRNDEIKISLRQKVGNVMWGLTEKGWVSLYYVKLTEVEPGEVEDMNMSGTTNDTTNGSTTPGGTIVGTGTTVISSGKIYNCNTLRIRAAAGTRNAHVGDYAAGTYVDIYETTTVGSQIWGRTDKGWISMRYVKLDAPTTGAGVTGRVFRTNTVNVRSGAGTHFPKTGSLAKGTKVEIFEYVKVGNATWGRTAQGWVSLYYVSLDAPLSNLDNVATDSVPAETVPEATEIPALQYDITIATAANGVVTASASTAKKGTEVTLTVNPNANYVLESLSVKTAAGTNVAVTNNKFTMPESNVTVTATFRVQYNVKIQNATGGKVTANKVACDAGTQILLTVTPDAGQALKTLSIVNTATNKVTELYNDETGVYEKNAFTMPAADVNVVATFKKSTGTAYAVKVNAMTNGEVAANVSSAKKGEKVIVVVNPAADYLLDELTVRNPSNKPVETTLVEANTYSFVMPNTDVAIGASFKREKFDVNIVKATGGSVTIAVPGTYKNGETVTLIVTENAEYKLKELKVTAGSTEIKTNNSGSTYTFTMPGSEVEVKPTFEKIQYALTINKSSNGTVTAAKNAYAKGAAVELKVEPKTGYELDTLTYKDADGKNVAITDNKFTMPGHATSVKATFKKAKYDVNLAQVEGVYMAADKTAAEMGETVTLNVYGLAGYKVTSMSVKDADGEALTVSSAKFTMPASDVTISVVVEKIPYNVTVNDSQNGTVDVEKDTYTVGDEVALDIDPANGYALKQVVVKTAKETLTVTDDGKFIMPAADVEITATFERAYNVKVNNAIKDFVSTEVAAAAEGAEVKVTVTPPAGCVVDKVYYTRNNSQVQLTKDGDTYKFTMPAQNVEIMATFKFEVKIEASEGGTVTANPEAGNYGEWVTLTAQANEGYVFKSWTVKDANGRNVTVQNDRFQMPWGAVTVKANFEKIHKVTVAKTGNGQVKINGQNVTEITAKENERVTVSVSAMSWNVNVTVKDNAGNIQVTESFNNATYAREYTFTVRSSDVAVNVNIN